VRRWLGYTPALRRDPILLFIVGWTALAAVLFFVLDGRVAWQVHTFWFGQLPLDALLCVGSWRVSRVATGPARRFWRVLTGVGALFTFGDTFQTVLTFLDPGRWSTGGGLVQSTCFATGLVVVVVAMLVHPHPSRTGRERLAFYLDSATVLVGGAVVAWSFAVSPGNTSGSAVLTTLGAAAAAITAGFAAIKMILSGNAPMHKAAAISMMSSSGFVTLGVFLETPSSGELPALYYLVRFMPSLLITLGPRIQEVIAGYDEAPFGERRRKPYSLLPYGSIAVAFGVLLVVMPSGVDARMWGVVVGLGLICALVAGRQLAAFHDNTSLIRRLDATLAELREHEARLRYQALYDGLTSLANRTHFHEEVEAALAGPGRITVLLVDLDGFKAVNDSLGHAAGDELLVSVADKLRAALRTGDVAARLGGDEFGVMLRDATEADAGRTADRILAALTEPVLISNTSVRANASIGTAEAEPGDDVSVLLRRADIAMYAAKSAGKGAWLCYQPEMEAFS